MLDLLRDAVRRLRRAGADYADARHVDEERLQLGVRDQRVERSLTARSRGFGVRVLWQGTWGFAARPGAADDAAALAAAADEALAVARAVAALGGARVRLAEEEPCSGHYATPVAEDPFALPRAVPLELLTEVTAALGRHAGARGLSAGAQLGARRSTKALATSDGTAVTQTIVHSGAGLKLTVGDGELVQQRSYPMEIEGGLAAGGFEVVRALDLLGQVPRVADEALALLQAPPCPAGERTVILDTPQLAMQIHESCGHPTEADRAFGDEVSLAGGSFLDPGRLGRYRYGSQHVNLSADALAPGGLGSFGWDDEGVPARKTPLVARGQFVGYLTTRETAARLGLPRSGGCLRADGWNRVPILRMINVSLEPDPRGPTLAELIADTDDGLLIGSNRSWSIDDVRLNFQFGCEIAWEIKHGRIARVVRNPIYTGSTPRLWAGCDAVCGPSELRLWGINGCGKGDPMQLMAVGHGCAPARFRGVRVGSAA